MPMELNNIYLLSGMIILIIVIVIVGLIYYISHLKETIKLQEAMDENNKLIINKLKQEKEKLARRLSRIVYNEYVQQQTKSKQKYKPSKKLKVIIGDYMLESAIITNTALKKLGLDTIVVPTPEDIIDIIDSGMDIDLIITNNIYKDSNLDGPHMLYKLRDEYDCKTSVIILTVSGGKEYHFITECGFNGYLTKPLKVESAIECISKIKPKIKFNKLP